MKQSTPMGPFVAFVLSIKLASLATIIADTGPFTPSEWPQQIKCPDQQLLNSHQNYNHNLTGNVHQEAHILARNGSSLRARPRSSLKSILQDLSDSYECKREESAWRWRYVEETYPKFKILIKEKSVDERLANILYTTTTNKITNFDYFRFNSGNQKQDALNERAVIGSANVDDQLCGKQLSQMLAIFEQMSAKVELARSTHNDSAELEDHHLRLARVLDSFGRYGSGHFAGRTHLVGSYSQCLKTELILNPQKPEDLTGSRYCWAHLAVGDHLNPSLKLRKKTQYETQNLALVTGICIPESCHSRSFDKNRQLFQQLIDSQFELPKSIYVNNHPRIESIFCTVDEKSQVNIPLAGKLLLLFIGAWLFLLILATLLNQSSAKDIGGKKLKNDSTLSPSALQCLDVRASWEEFMCHNEPQRRGRVQLDTLNPIKWFGCLFVVYGHGIIVLSGTSPNYLECGEFMEKTPVGAMILVGTSVVDTFFVITGIILAYITMKRANRRKETIAHPEGVAMFEGQQHANGKNLLVHFLNAVFKIIKTRYLRLIPLFALVYFFKRLVFIYLGKGPLWDHGFNQDTYMGACQNEAWWTPFALIAAYLPLSKQCLMQSWSVSCDMIFTACMAPVLVIMTRKPKLAAHLASGLCIASIATACMEYSKLDPSDDWNMRDLRAPMFSAFFNQLTYVYTAAHFRISAIVVGVAAGYVLYYYDEGEKIKEWPSWFKGPATILSAVFLIGCCIFIGYMDLIRYLIAPFHLYIVPTYMTIGKPIWAIANAVFFLRMMTDWQDSYLMTMSSSKFWKIFSKMNYAILLIHYDIAFYDAGVALQTKLFTRWDIFTTFCMTYTVCISLSAILFVLFENPIDKLTKRYLL